MLHMLVMHEMDHSFVSFPLATAILAPGREDSEHTDKQTRMVDELKL